MSKIDKAKLPSRHVTEGPERAPHRIPEDALHINLAIDGAARRATLSGPERWSHVR